MAILKNIIESGTSFEVLFERNKYVTALTKTSPALIGARGCCAENFPKISRALKRFYRRNNNKMLRHFVVGISPCDEGRLQNTKLLKAARKVSGFFRDCYVLYAVHTDTMHTHFHILVCNTRISDGKQISMSDSELKRFKEHCSSVLREYGLRPIEKIDKSNEPLEINEDLFPKELSQEERANILYDGVVEPQYAKKQHYYPEPVQNCGNTTTVNVILPPGTQGTLFQGRNGQPCISFKPSPFYGQLPCGNIPQSNAVCGGNTVVEPPTPEPSSYPLDWYDQDPPWIKESQPEKFEVDGYGVTSEETDDYDNCSDFDDYDGDDCYYDEDDDDCQEIEQTSPDNKPLNGGAMAETELSSNKINPIKIFDVIPPQTGTSGKIIPIVFLKERKE